MNGNPAIDDFVEERANGHVPVEDRVAVIEATLIAAHERKARADRDLMCFLAGAAYGAILLWLIRR